jgi:hypothetical protein
LPKKDASKSSSHSPDAKNGQSALPSSPIASAETRDKEYSKPAKKDQLPANNNDEWARWSLYVNAAMAVATFVLAVYAVKQANAAKASTEIAANAERSWIVTEGVDNPDLQQVWLNSVIYRFKVIGNSPIRPLEAKIIYTLVKSRADGHHQEPDLPEQPIYGEPLDLDSSPSMGRIHAPNDPIVVTGRLESLYFKPDDIKAITEGLKFMCAYGFIRYRDAFAEKKRRETRFCFVCGNRGPLSQKVEDGFVVGGPPAYNDIFEIRNPPAWERFLNKAMSAYRKAQQKTKKAN